MSFQSYVYMKICLRALMQLSALNTNRYPVDLVLTQLTDQKDDRSEMPSLLS